MLTLTQSLPLPLPLPLTDGAQEAMAVRDMVDSDHVPVFGPGLAQRQASVAGQALGRGGAGGDEQSSVLRSLRHIPRTQVSIAPSPNLEP